MLPVTYIDFQEPTVNASWLNSVGSICGQEVFVDDPQFGAIGNGVADDSQSILAAINAALANANGGTVVFGAKTYNMGSSLAVVLGVDQGLTFRGQGHATKIRYSGSGVSQALFHVGGGSPVFGANFSCLNMGSIINSGPQRADAFYLQNINSSLFFNTNLFNSRNGIVLDSSFNTRIFGCYVYGASANGVTTATTGTNSLIIRDSVFQACPTAINLLVGGNNILVEGNDFEGNGIDLGITNYTSVRFAGNYCELETNARFFFGGTNQMVDIEQNWLGQSAVTTNLGNVISGNFRKNTLYQSAWTTSNGTGSDFVVGVNFLSTGATLETTEWNIPALLNGFTTQSVNYYPVQYLKNEDGLVTMRGNTLNGAANTLAFTLPAGYRPAKMQTFATASSAAPGASSIEVRSNGDVYCITRDASGGCGWNVSWYAEQ